jgi:phosphoribosylanthranilate isomerase
VKNHFFMNNIIIQIYEVQTSSEAEKLIELGVDHIGSVVVSGNEWKQPLIRDTINLIDSSTSKSSLILLFNDPDTVFRALNYYQPDIVHFCEALIDNNGISKICIDLINLQKNVKEKFPEIKIIRSIPISKPGIGIIPSIELARMFEPTSDYFLTDTLLVKKSENSIDCQPVKGFVGITGQTCDWDTAAKLVEFSRIPIILAGGITPDNVFDGIMHVHPAGVDSCTGTNAIDQKGCTIRFKKDFDKVKQFVENARRTEVGGQRT